MTTNRSLYSIGTSFWTILYIYISFLPKLGWFLQFSSFFKTPVWGEREPKSLFWTQNSDTLNAVWSPRGSGKIDPQVQKYSLWNVATTFFLRNLTFLPMFSLFCPFLPQDFAKSHFDLRFLPLRTSLFDQKNDVFFVFFDDFCEILMIFVKFWWFFDDFGVFSHFSALLFLGGRFLPLNLDGILTIFSDFWGSPGFPVLPPGKPKNDKN